LKTKEKKKEAILETIGKKFANKEIASNGIAGNR